MKVLNAGGVKVYDLCVGKTLPQWLAEKPHSRGKLSKDPEFRKRIELVQDFQFPTASKNIKTTNDGNYIFASGNYPPVVKCFDTRELSLKFERRIDADIVQFEVLADDFTKLVLLGDNRTLYFHAAYGHHYKTRIPKFGRDLCFNGEVSDLMIAASDSEVYRVNLEQGQFMSGVVCKDEYNKLATGVNVLQYNPALHLLVAGTENGFMSFFDLREKPSPVISLNLSRIEGLSGGEEVTALGFDRSDYLKLALGTSIGTCSLFDIRSYKPLVTKQHNHELPIKKILFQNLGSESGSGSLVISADKKVIKLWHKETGENFTTAEAQADMSDICLVDRKDSRKLDTSGLLLATGEQSRVMSFYIPRLGPAPKWCVFLDSITEELEEKTADKEAVYENYKFITREELDRLGLAHLVGSAMLRPYMHGFFMDLKLYHNVKVLVDRDRDALDEKERKKQRIEKKLQQEAGERIQPKRKRVRVNKKLMEKLEDAQAAATEQATEVPSKDNGSLAKDARFSQLFADPDFEIDEESDHFKQVYTSGSKQMRRRTEEAVEDSESDSTEEEASLEDSAQDTPEVEIETKPKIIVTATDSVTDDSDATGNEDSDASDEPLWKRVQEEKSETSKKTTVKALGGGNIEMTFTPSNRRPRRSGAKPRR